MKLTQSFKLAIKSIMSSKVRSFLTMLGIIIGVGAVIVIMSLGNGMTAEMNDSFASIGTNLLNVSLTGKGSVRNVTDADMFALAGENPDTIAYISPNVPVMATVKLGNEILESTSVTGVSEDYKQIKTLDLTQGRFIGYADSLNRNDVCVIGSYIADTYFPQQALGGILKINGYEYTIVGVIDETSDSKEGGNDDAVIIAYTNALRLSGMAFPSSYSFGAASDKTVSEAEKIINDSMYKAFGNEDAYKVTNFAALLDTLASLSNTMILVLAAIAGISLLVGGIGIMNIMLVSVTERTREIGIRKSLGAKRRDIMRQFVIEAAATGLVGGIVGIVFGVVGASLLGPVLDVTAVPSVSAIFLASGVSLAVGVIFGILPANKAARLNPIDALRYD